MRKVKIPRAAGQPPTGEKSESTSKSNFEEIDLQALYSHLAPGESVPIAPGICFFRPIEFSFNPIPAPDGWKEEFGAVAVHPGNGEIIFHQAFFVGPEPWPDNLPDPESQRISLTDAWLNYARLRGNIKTLAFKAWRLTGIHADPEKMNAEVRALWEGYQKEGA
jgi:hypothetical protein